jgi:hypothetical protein
LSLKPEKGGCDRTGSKIQNRDPWYEVPLPEHVDGFLSGMTRLGPWITWKRMRGLSATNTLYVISCKERLSRSERYAWSISLLTSQARRAARTLGRRYADGLVKYEPRDLKKIPLPQPSSRKSAEDLYQRIVNLLVAGREGEAERLADKFCSLK